MENLSPHYVLTLERWHENWQKNRATILESYGERWYRLWNIFLSWSARIAAQGTSACFQVVAHRNDDRFDRKRLVFPEPAAAPLGPIVDTASAAE